VTRRLGRRGPTVSATAASAPAPPASDPEMTPDLTAVTAENRHPMPRARSRVKLRLFRDKTERWRPACCSGKSGTSPSRN
jgi:hypothetical protein